MYTKRQKAIYADRKHETTYYIPYFSIHAELMTWNELKLKILFIKMCVAIFVSSQIRAKMDTLWSRLGF